MKENTKYALITFAICYILTALTMWHSFSRLFALVDTIIIMYYYRQLYNKMFDVVYFGTKGYIQSLIVTFVLAMLTVFILLVPIALLYGLLGITVAL